MSQFDRIKTIQKENISVNQLLSSPVQLTTVVGGEGLENLIQDKNLHRPQLALAGFVDLFTYHRVQVFGNTEIYYLQSLKASDRIKAFEKICEFAIPCIILTNNHTLEQELLFILEKKKIAVFSTPFETTKTIFLLSDFLDDQFALQIALHGSFVDVYGVGVLLTGRSGIGKSEIALDLIERGHRLVADDLVMFTKKRESVLMGTGTNLSQHFMEIRGLGIIDVEKMFGIRAIRFQKRLEIIVELEEWNKNNEYTRTGLEEAPLNLVNVDVSSVKLPLFPGKNVTVITEVIALNYLLRTYGYNAAKVFADRLQEQINVRRLHKSSTHDQRLVSYFQSDDE
ncbi:MAG: HPr kinase/phosphorylase [Bacteroidetes bacterium]|nr:HPr kinase/phosphorylase [Bacteroidota bacterium]